ncbi:hypothetical protein EN828_10400 [Mesorhizobium sp. M2D.F.Ca.ET.185.01.1.1]|uniref:hypothetical protein n=1 Tax=unclassified Mesorhizobium TaxID=325217 RepID=UPI000FC9A59E|nr:MULTISPECIES: hypothetical protein [unclassified Mesorhizobium]TGT96038.1 hypothetical protein EN806_53235 [bacterium M00.F.Ca.ET.163.01.1.1]TGV77480.1 hypothetical protein EN792_048930 [Mesorhizobium sp. M00.F.Ca.ET.149.01.1.1]TGP25887.1 hypothetical protein EN875_034570 [Mesorhizobium sp. M2D.F.Ca.ET.232.01.1.1]TGQ22471.1 hypothetical protein EN863_066070 [Mesorhizobium sp. M00.F.Ca.ET.220.01.1.1]TGQ89446.1 hypothetical protein EN849_09900 [Mesorhizobium sp. M2D.F.Ca.ET.206.01.1.1]
MSLAFLNDFANAAMADAFVSRLSDQHLQAYASRHFASSNSLKATDQQRWLRVFAEQFPEHH